MVVFSLLSGKIKIYLVPVAPEIIMWRRPLLIHSGSPSHKLLQTVIVSDLFLLVLLHWGKQASGFMIQINQTDSL